LDGEGGAIYLLFIRDALPFEDTSGIRATLGFLKTLQGELELAGCTATLVAHGLEG